LTGFSDSRDSEVCQVFQELDAAGKVSAQGNFDIGERVSKCYQTISEKIDAQETGVGENLGPGGILEFKSAGNARLTAGMADVGLIVQSRECVGAMHQMK
jgi:hypothetical protein